MRQTTARHRHKPNRPIIQELRGPASIKLLERLLPQGTAGLTIIAIDFEYLSPPTYSGFTITEIGISTLSIDDQQQWVSTQRNIVHSPHQITPNKATRLNLTISFGESEYILGGNIPQFLKLQISH